MKEGTGRFKEPEEQEVCCDIAPPGHIRSCPHKDSQALGPKPELDRDGTSSHANVQENTHEASTPHQTLQAAKEC